MDIATLKKEARSKKTPAWRLEELARHTDTSIQLVVAKNPNASAKALEYLGGHGRFTILKAVAQNPNTPDVVLVKLATHKQETVREALLEQANLPTTAVEALSQNLRPERRWWLPWKFPSVLLAKPALLEQLMTDPTEGVRRSVAEHVPLSDEQFERVFGDTSPNVRAHLYKNPSTTPQRLERLLSHPDQLTRAAIARQFISMNDLLRFVKDSSPRVRAATVQHLHIPEDTLRQLATDESSLVRGAVAGRFFGAPLYLLRELSRDPEPFVRAGVAQNSNSTAEMLEELSRDVDERVRFCIACNLRTPETVIEHLVYDTSTTRFTLQGDSMVKTPNQELTIAERATEHLRQIRHPKTFESFQQPSIGKLFGK